MSTRLGIAGGCWLREKSPAIHAVLRVLGTGTRMHGTSAERMIYGLVWPCPKRLNFVIDLSGVLESSP